MNHIISTYPSKVLGIPVTFHVLLPKSKPGPFQQEQQQDSGPFQVLYLLHGAMESAEDWIRNSRIAELADTFKLAVVLPSVGNTFYLDVPDCLPMYSFVAHELYEYTHQIFPFSWNADDNFIGGNSMGGYGACYAALRNPAQYSKVISLSGALDFYKATSFIHVLGAPFPTSLYHSKDPAYSLKALLQSSIARKPSGGPTNSPAFYLACSPSDFFYQSNTVFAKDAREAGFPCEFYAADGNHDWNFWSENIEPAIRWLKEDNKGSSSQI